MRHYAVFDIRPQRPSAASGRRGPDPSLYSGGLDACGAAHGVLPWAGTTLRNHGLPLR